MPAVKEPETADEMPVHIGPREFGRPQAYVDGWNACRAAMLQAGNSPVTPDGWVLLPKKLTAPPATVVQPVMFIDGDISEIIEKLQMAENAERLKTELES